MYVLRTGFIFCAQMALIFFTYTFTNVHGSYDDYSSQPYKMIKKEGYPAEVHYINNDNRNTLELHRIPWGKTGRGKKDRIPILLHHGLFGSSKDWIINGPKNSLAYLLANKGYDVWMANARGNEYTWSYVPGHRDPTPESSWDFSFHEMGREDLPLIIDYILEETSYSQLIYIGHSLGSTIFFVMASERPEYNDKVYLDISLAPIGAISNSKSAYRKLFPKLEEFKRESREGWIMKSSSLFKELAKDIFCKETYHDTNTCVEDVISQLFGSDPEQLDPNMLPVIKDYAYAETSIKNLYHVQQLMTKEEFGYPDYSEEQKKRLGSSNASRPSYNISKIETPVLFFYGENDLVAVPEDVENLYKKFPSKLGLAKMDRKEFNHVDFIWAKDAKKMVYDKLVHFLGKATNYKSGWKFIQNLIESNKN